MGDRVDELIEVETLGIYEAPRLTPIGNLRDLLAGPGSQPCEGGAPAGSGGDEPPITGMPGVCTPE
jgi:hypothetical protein